MTFLYFGYGSNLLRERLQLMNPSAVFVTTAELKDCTVTFSTFGRRPRDLRWLGGAATIIESPGDTVWGCVWRLDDADRESLDRQEGVYDAKQVDVVSAEGETLSCRVYQLPADLLAQTQHDCRPSPAYMDVLVRGARQNQLPQNYITFLENIETNKIDEKPDVYKQTLQMLESNDV